MVGRRDIVPGAVIVRPTTGQRRRVVRVENGYVHYRDEVGKGICKVHNLITWHNRKPKWWRDLQNSESN